MNSSFGRLLCSIATAGAVVAASHSVVLPLAGAQTVSVTGKSPRGSAQGTGQGSLSASRALAGSTLHLSGTGFEQRTVADAFMGLKINDGAIAFPADQSAGDNLRVDGGFAYVEGEHLPGADGSWAVDLVLPQDLQPGDYWIRVLAGSDNDKVGSISKYVWFKVVKDASELGSYATAEFESAESLRVNAHGLKPSEEATIRVGERELGRARADESGELSALIAVPTGTVPAGTTAEVSLVGSEGTQATITVTGKAGFAASPQPVLGSTFSLTVSNIAPGTSVSSLRAGEVELLSEQHTSQVASADTLTLSGIAVPQQPGIAGTKLRATLSQGQSETVSDTGIAVTVADSKFGAEKFDLTETRQKSGLYQSAYSASKNSVYVTRSVGGVPFREAGIARYDADSLALIKEVQPETVPGAQGGFYGPFGIAIDDALGLVWVTNPRQSTIAVYDLDLNLKHQWPIGAVGYARDVVVDETTHRAYVSVPASGKNTLEVFEGTDLQAPSRSIELGSHGLTDSMGLDIDPSTGDIYVGSAASPAVAKVNDRGASPEVTVWTIAGDATASTTGVTYDRANHVVWTSSQATGNAVALDATQPSGAQTPLANIATGAGALNIKYNPADKLVYVSNFGTDTVTVIDSTRREALANLEVDHFPHHVSAGKDGNVYILTKGNIGTESDPVNLLVKVKKKTSDVSDDPGKGSSSSNTGSQNSSGSSDSSSALGSSVTTGVVAGVIAAVGLVLAMVGHSDRLVGALLAMLPKDLRARLNL